MSGSADYGSTPAAREPQANAGRTRVAVVVLFVLGLPLVLVALALGSAPTRPTAAAKAGGGPSSAVSFDLGRVMCGECCVGNLWKAIGSMPGVRDIDAKPGNRKFVVYYDPVAVDPERMLTTLVTAGEAGVSVAAAEPTDAEHRTERHWVRPVRR